jgi:hypothetical protein
MKALPAPDVLVRQWLQNPHAITVVAFAATGVFGASRLPSPWAFPVGSIIGALASLLFYYADHRRFVRDPAERIVADRWQIVLAFAGFQWTRDKANRHFFFSGDTGSGKTSGMNGLLAALIRRNPMLGGVVMANKGDEWFYLEWLAKKYGREKDIIRLRPRLIGESAPSIHRLNVTGDTRLPFTTRARILVDTAAALNPKDEKSFFKIKGAAHIGRAQPGPLSDLAEVGAVVATAAQKEEAQKAAAARFERDRTQLHNEAQEMLAENIGRLWEKIHTQVPAAQRSQWRRNPCNVKIHLGGAVLEIGRIVGSMVRLGEFAHSRWDVVTSSALTVVNGSGRQYTWEVSLWFVKQPTDSDYRWVEAGYFAPFQGRTAPFSANGYREADLVASPITSGVQFAWGPTPIDGEHENEFHDRCLWLFAKAAKGALHEPRHQPVNAWPSQM